MGSIWELFSSFAAPLDFERRDFSIGGKVSDLMTNTGMRDAP